MSKLLAPPQSPAENPRPPHTALPAISGGIIVNGGTSRRTGGRADLLALLPLVGRVFVLARGIMSSYMVSDGRIPAHAGGG